MSGQEYRRNHNSLGSKEEGQVECELDIMAKTMLTLSRMYYSISIQFISDFYGCSWVQAETVYALFLELRAKDI